MIPPKETTTAVAAQRGCVSTTTCRRTVAPTPERPPAYVLNRSQYTRSVPAATERGCPLPTTSSSNNGRGCGRDQSSCPGSGGLLRVIPAMCAGFVSWTLTPITTTFCSVVATPLCVTDSLEVRFGMWNIYDLYDVVHSLFGGVIRCLPSFVVSRTCSKPAPVTTSISRWLWSWSGSVLWRRRGCSTRSLASVFQRYFPVNLNVDGHFLILHRVKGETKHWEWFKVGSNSCVLSKIENKLYRSFLFIVPLRKKNN